MKPACSVLLLAVATLHAGDYPSMTKIVVRYVPAEGNAPGEPKVIYRSQERYARIEETLRTNVGNIIIVNEPDVWVVRTDSKLATHSVNKGPDLTVHSPILGLDSPDELTDFEFGRELEFVRRLPSDAAGDRHVGDRHCKEWTFGAADWLIHFLVDEETQLPVEVIVLEKGMLKMDIRYLHYNSNLPFQPDLFQLPKDAKVIEGS
jgi:hypothetical protein